MTTLLFYGDAAVKLHTFLAITYIQTEWENTLYNYESQLEGINSRK